MLSHASLRGPLINTENQWFSLFPMCAEKGKGVNGFRWTNGFLGSSLFCWLVWSINRINQKQNTHSGWSIEKVKGRRRIEINEWWGANFSLMWTTYIGAIETHLKIWYFRFKKNTKNKSTLHDSYQAIVTFVFLGFEPRIFEISTSSSASAQSNCAMNAGNMSNWTVTTKHLKANISHRCRPLARQPCCQKSTWTSVIDDLKIEQRKRICRSDY